MKNIRPLVQENQKERGQALITMIFFIVIAVSILSASALILASSMQNTSISEQGLLTYSAAESGAEDGILYLLRNPVCSQTLGPYPVNDADVHVSITCTGTTNVITSQATMGSTMRKIEIQTSRANGTLTISSWKEI